MEKYIKDYKNYLKMVGLADRTIKIYTSILKKFLQNIDDPKQATQSQIIQFIVNRGSARTIKQTHGALNHFYSGVLNLMYIKKIPQPKAPRFVPNILTQLEAYQVLSNIKNLKHESILQLIYSGGLRISEALNLKIVDVSKTENQIKIISGKGNKTAYVPIPEATKNLLREYYHHYKPKVYLFEGKPGVKYSKSSVRQILKKALKTVNITKRIRVHDLRHSRATHLLENGMGIKILKDFMRHKKIETTEIYLHLTTKTIENAIQQADLKMQNNIMQNPKLTIKAA